MRKDKRSKKRYGDVPVYHVKQQFYDAKFDKRECARVASTMKNQIPPTTLSVALYELFKVSPQYKELLWGHQFPRCVKDLGEGNGFFFKSKGLLNEINWIYIQISRCHKELSTYVEYRNKVEKLILLGYYDEALDCLELITKRLGFSIWYYEMKMLIYSYQNKERLIFEMLSDINEEKRDSKSGFICLLLSYLCKRSMKSYSAYAYDAELNSRFKMDRTDFQKDRFVYYQFRLNFYNNYNYEDLSPVLIMESTNSLIDRYNLLIYLLRAEFSNTDLAMEKSIYSVIAQKIYRKTNDKLLVPFLAYLDIESIPDSYYNEELLCLFDSYYIGEYDATEIKCREFIKNDPSYFDVIKLYCRSLIAQKKNYYPITPLTDSIINQVANTTYNVMSELQNDESLHKLYQINKHIYGLSIACGLDYFIKLEQNENPRKDLRLLSLYYWDPLFCEIYDTIDQKNRYLEIASQRFADSHIIPYQDTRNRKTQSDDLFICEYIRCMDAAKLLYNNCEYREALILWNQILEKNASIIPIIQSAVDYIYRCYEQLDDKQSAIEFYVRQYLRGTAYVSHVNTQPLINLLYKEKYKKGVKNSIELQLFVFLNAKEDERKSCVLERYCRYKDVSCVSELILELEDFVDKQKLELYFYLLASEDILRHMVYVKSTKTMLEEQQKVAQYLTTLVSSPYHKLYCDLNQELLDTMIVFQNVRKIDESKIFVNQNALVKYEFKEYEGLYKQFKNQLSMSAESNQLYLVNSVSPWEENLKDATVICPKVRFTNKAFIDVACQLFSVIREKFLFSKFGLKTYLSTRIRHGVLEGELRSGFDRLHLILSTVNGRYLDIDYWRNEYRLDQHEHSELMRFLQRFSQGINNAIDVFKERVLQIRIEESAQGCFEYILTPDDMCFATVMAEVRTSDFDEFCYAIMEYLLKMTSKCLISVRNEITRNLCDTFNGLLDNLEQDIQKFNHTHIYKALSDTVSDARAQSNLKISRIEKWFYLQDAKFDDFSLYKQMDIVWNITSKMYPNINSEVKRYGEEDDIMIKSSYFIHLSDILTIFYNNMFSYSKPMPTRRFVVGLEKINDGFVRMHFENDIKESEEVLNVRLREMQNLENRLQLEGKSGLVKVRKIIKYDLGHENNELIAKAENGKCIIDVIINTSEICVN